LGRASSAKIRVPASFRHVSRLHAEFSAEKGSIFLRDLGSRTGTQVNGVWLEPKKLARLATGDRLWFGGLEMFVLAEISTLAQVLAETSPRPVPIIDLQNDVSTDSTIHLTPGIRSSAQSPARDILSSLTQAELEVLLWICRGYFEDQDIAKQLHRSPNTVRTHVASIFRRLSVNSRAEVMAFVKRQSAF
jgi:DNA-binding CsgD family transcriptional regulator